MSRADELSEDLAELLERIVEALDLDGDVEVVDDGETLTGTVHGDDLGLFIGHHGQTIDAIQHLASRMQYTDVERPSRRIVIDAGDYRERRRETLEDMADDAADEALRTGRPAPLVPMPAAERRLVHEYLRDRDDIDTHSEGDEPDRRLVVAPRG